MKDQKLKDQRLWNIAQKRNVAMFASYAPGNRGRFRMIDGFRRPRTVEQAIEIISMDGKRTVNIRSFREDGSLGCPFVTGLAKDEAILEARRLMKEGFHVMVNEDIPRDENMISGVTSHGHVEMAPRDTPRCVEAGNCSTIPVPWGNRIASALLGEDIAIPSIRGRRIEFSAYARPVGVRRKNVLVWEDEEDGAKQKIFINERDPFAAHLGDKAWGLMLAWAAGFSVPRTSIFLRRTFYPAALFGADTGQVNAWTRTCPKEFEPGKYTTLRGFNNPFELMRMDDPEGDKVVSCLVQQEVKAEWAGAAMTGRKILIEGARGFGDGFMAGRKAPEKLPEHVWQEVWALCNDMRNAFNANVRIEWAFDGERLWILQAHIHSANIVDGCFVYPGKPERWLEWRTEEGLDALRELVSRNPGCGVILLGGAGFTSHAADICRKAQFPSYVGIERKRPGK